MLNCRPIIDVLKYQSLKHRLYSHVYCNIELSSGPRPLREIIMKKFIPAACLVALIASSAILPANAQYSQYNWGVNGTQAQLQSKINVGIRNGSLTASEASQLQAKMNRINSLEARFRATGGRLSPRERERLNRQLAQLSFDIDRQMSDFQRRHIGYRGNHGWHR
jgi:hypothetical protein